MEERGFYYETNGEHRSVRTIGVEPISVYDQPGTLERITDDKVIDFLNGE